MPLHELVVISGKGGTGKTMVTSSLVPFLPSLTIADCDVDAPDLHILLDPKEKKRERFVGTRKAVIDPVRCTRCGLCRERCRFNAITPDITMFSSRCEGCGVCAYVCPEEAISLEDAVAGYIYESTTAYGSMVHARLVPGEETSGKLVAEVRRRAKEKAGEKGEEVLLIDGSPGIGCNVISSLTGASFAVVITEPTRSGLHDLERVWGVITKFSLPAVVVINKYDLAEEMTRCIERFCGEHGITIALKIPFDPVVVEAVVRKKIPSLYAGDFFSRIGFSEFVDVLLSMPASGPHSENSI